MDEQITTNIDKEELKKIPYRRHIPVKDDTFSEFRKYKKQFKPDVKRYADDGFVNELLRVYRLYLTNKERKLKEEQNAMPVL